MCIGRRLFDRVRNGFYVQDKTPRLTLGMTRMIFIFRDPSTARFLGLPKIAAKRDFWEEERQAQQARRQAQRAVCHGALTRRAQDDRRENGPGRDDRKEGKGGRRSPRGQRGFCTFMRDIVLRKPPLSFLNQVKIQGRPQKRYICYMERRADMTISSMPEAPRSTAPLTARTLSARV